MHNCSHLQNMRAVYSCSICTLAFMMSSSINTALASGAIAYLLHIPIPSNVDNFLLMYCLLLKWKITDMFGHSMVKLGIVTEHQRRRHGTDSVKFDLVKGVQMDVKNMKNYDLYIFTPKDLNNNGAVIYYHGGGFVIMHVSTYQRFLSSMAKELGCVIFAPNYRKAPEHHYPAGDLDACHATKYIFSNAETYNIDRNRLVLSGDSAGGYLAISTWYRLRDYFTENKVKPLFISLIYPGFGYRFDSPSFQRNGAMPILGTEDALYYYFLHAGWEFTEEKIQLALKGLHYEESGLCPSSLSRSCPEKWLDSKELSDWVKPTQTQKSFSSEQLQFREKVTKKIVDGSFNPLNISDEELADIPPVATYVSEHDVLKNDGQIFHNRLKHIGKDSTIFILEGDFHGQFAFSKQFSGSMLFTRTTDRVKRYVTKIGTYLQYGC